MPGIGHLSAGMSFRAPRYRYLRFFENMKNKEDTRLTPSILHIKNSIPS